jgi:hypothetical protein
MTDTTTLYYASVKGLTGLAFAIGHVVLFTPTETDTVHVVRDAAALVITARVPNLLASFLKETIVEPRLAHLGGGAR